MSAKTDTHNDETRKTEASYDAWNEQNINGDAIRRALIEKETDNAVKLYSSTSPLSAIIVGDIIRLHGSDVGFLRPDHFCIVVADSQYRLRLSVMSGIQLYAVTLMESVTGTKSVHWGCVLMTQENDICYVVHGARPADRKSWIRCDVLGCLTPADPASFSSSLRETGCRKSRVGQGQDKWSYRTGLYAVLHSASLRNKNISDAENLERIMHSWECRPICTSTIIRSWQRYLVELAKTDEEALENIIQYMPLLSDRAMPKELLNTLKETGKWVPINEIAKVRQDLRKRRWSGRALLIEALALCD